ncbi:hypothetical protein ERO13_A09G246700v2 [Gossypium hirsutum]|uniref:Uncharacterized protein isoform X2 n=1 Tax=Gossypium hirsutum TaxID=3635 RepID=A0ABM2YS62_GOSHI|nr:uncharacterized protein LOC121206461 isoform X2 [Gossypium hirsutum]KAG4185666.1 hypothetical protein ERO13_A09G246700v2 [Gossypium hirsutum]
MEMVAGQGAVSFNQIQRPMEDSSSHPFEHDQTAPGASKFLSDLPSRGHLSSPIISSNLGVMQVYICEHNTSPPESQHIKTDQQNILIRSLMLNNNKGGSSSKDVKAAAEGPRKRAAEKVMDSSASAKKANTKNNSQSALAHPLSTMRLIFLL